MQKSMLSLKELALETGLSEATIRRLKADKLIPFVQPRPRGRILFPRDAMNRCLQGAAQAPDAHGPVRGDMPAGCDTSPPIRRTRSRWRRQLMEERP